jgi:putative phosphoesterase
LNVVVLSDTHGNLKGLREAVKGILSRHSVDLFVHLGDDYRDAEVFDEFGCEYVRVPGVYSDYYADRSVPNRIVKDFEGWRFLLSHTDQSHANDLRGDLRPERLVADGRIDILLSGHSHVPKIDAQDGILLVNPGHLKDEDKKGHRPTYALLGVRKAGIRAALIEAETGKVLGQVDFTRVN